jgi:hypothetical protein
VRTRKKSQKKRSLSEAKRADETWRNVLFCFSEVKRGDEKPESRENRRGKGERKRVLSHARNGNGSSLPIINDRTFCA